MPVKFTKTKMKLNFKKDKPTVYKIQQVNYGAVDTETLTDDVAEACGMNRAMTKAIIEAIVQRTCRYIGMGLSVQLGDLGTIKPVFTTKTKETVDELGADNIRNKKVRFYPGARLNQVVKNLSVVEYDLSENTVIEEDDDDTPTNTPTDPEDGGTSME